MNHLWVRRSPQFFLIIVLFLAFGAYGCSKKPRAGECLDGSCEEVGTPVMPGPVGSNMVCIDGDGDGYGAGCALGADCDDGNAAQRGVEVCADGQDNDCDGSVDEIASTACGCEINCQSAPIGGAGSPPFDLSQAPSSGLIVNPDGSLSLSSNASTRSYIWIANSGQGSISKIRTDEEPFIEEARYFTGPRTGYNCYSDPDTLGYSCGYLEGVDPSRTSVNGEGDIFIGNRLGGRITKIAGDIARCSDRNGDGQFTSSGPADVRPWGSDDCVRWDTKLVATSDPATTLTGDPARVRAVAAQDIEGIDGRLQHYVWVGDTDVRLASGQPQGVIWKLDGETGEVLLTTRINGCRPYGFALDGSANLWVSCRENSALGRLDTLACTSTTACSSEIGDAQTCVGEGVQGGRNCDTAIKQRIALGAKTYGITVDFKQRVWIAAHGDGGGIFRYDASQSAGARLSRFQTDGAQNIGDTVGVTADLRGFVYAGLDGSSILQLESDSAPAANRWLKVPLGSTRSWGMATDFQGRVWVIGRYQPIAQIAKPTATLGTLENPGGSLGIGGLSGPYTYSDMTGSQLRFATNPSGAFRHVFSGCESGTTNWRNLVWDADVPAGTRLVFFVRLADSQAELDLLEDSDFQRVAEVPSDVVPVNLGALLQAANIPMQKLIEVEVQLKSDNNDPTQPQTPVLRSLDVSHVCTGGTLG